MRKDEGFLIKDEGLRMKDEGRGSRAYAAAPRPYSSFILHPLSLILHPSSLRSGITLLEVLISVFVLSVGLMGMAALLPVGRYAIVETGKADRAGACGRAALHQIKVCRMLDPVNWSNQAAGNSGGSFAVDPLGVSKLGTAFGGVIPRITLNGISADQVFTCQDDLSFVKPEDMSYTSRRPAAGGHDPFQRRSGDRRQLLLVLHCHALAGGHPGSN